MPKVYVGDVGTAIILDTGQPLASALSLAIVARKPSGAEVTWAAEEFEATKVRFIAPVGTFDQEGTWKLQSKVVLSTGEWLGQTVNMRVYIKFT